MERERGVALPVPLRFLREVAQDSRHTLRLWANRPWQTAFAILALAIGIGANTGVFSVVNALLLRSLPFREPSRLAALVDFDAFVPPHDSAKQFHDWRQQSTYLADVALLEQLGPANSLRHRRRERSYRAIDFRRRKLHGPGHFTER